MNFLLLFYAGKEQKSPGLYLKKIIIIKPFAPVSVIHNLYKGTTCSLVYTGFEAKIKQIKSRQVVILTILNGLKENEKQNSTTEKYILLQNTNEVSSIKHH